MDLTPNNEENGVDEAMALLYNVETSAPAQLCSHSAPARHLTANQTRKRVSTKRITYIFLCKSTSVPVNKNMCEFIEVVLNFTTRFVNSVMDRRFKLLIRPNTQGTIAFMLLQLMQSLAFSWLRRITSFIGSGSASDGCGSSRTTR
jgi:hypothetical protein